MQHSIMPLDVLLLHNTISPYPPFFYIYFSGFSTRFQCFFLVISFHKQRTFKVSEPLGGCLLYLNHRQPVEICKPSTALPGIWIFTGCRFFEIDFDPVFRSENSVDSQSMNQ
jgi:hypothetical protein